MSNNALAIGQATFGQIIGDIVSNLAATRNGARQIGNLQPHITTQEIHRDEDQITQHPVETGTPVTDHVFPMPYTVEMHVAWSDSTAQTSGFAQAIYQALLSLKATRQPFAIVSGKRPYSSMLIKSLMVTTDPETEYVLAVVVLCQQLVVTNTQTTGGGVSNTDGNAMIGTINPSSATGVPAEPGLDFGNGVGTIPPGAISGNFGGTMTWPNQEFGGGNIELTPADPGAPTVESLTQNQGV